MCYPGLSLSYTRLTHPCHPIRPCAATPAPALQPSTWIPEPATFLSYLSLYSLPAFLSFVMGTEIELPTGRFASVEWITTASASLGM